MSSSSLYAACSYVTLVVPTRSTRTNTSSRSSNLAGAWYSTLDARITTLEAVQAAQSCPDPSAPQNFGFCIWHDPGAATYTQSYWQAAATCKSKGARLCTSRELSAAVGAGAEWCAWSWIADKGVGQNTTGPVAFPMQRSAPGCGAAGVNTQSASLATPGFDAACCK